MGQLQVGDEDFMTTLELNNTPINRSKSKIDSGTCPIVVDNFHRYLILVYIIYRRCRVFMLGTVK